MEAHWFYWAPFVARRIERRFPHLGGPKVSVALAPGRLGKRRCYFRVCVVNNITVNRAATREWSLLVFIFPRPQLEGEATNISVSLSELFGIEPSTLFGIPVGDPRRQAPVA